ncbi:C3 and PZP-like alpha-2-macroglobulin domain-containing protein 8 [Mytilus edulis]|uniref:C3 and PZP-like alpha-2-macroglobulin domain-containing protein 8 n=1 Tax=Mytilus edulis TaxID=6550 RepID=UPI0039EFB4F3
MFAMKMTDYFVFIRLLLLHFHCGYGIGDTEIQTYNSGNIDAASTPDIFNYYTNLSDYLLFPSQIQFFRFRVEACSDAFILLSSAENLQSQDFYEICIGANSNQATSFRRKYNTGAIYFLTTLDILSCTEKRTMVVRWTLDGKITLDKETSVGTEIVMEWTDPNPIPINGVGIMTGWGSNGLWAIEHSSFLFGSYCGVPTTYGNMVLLSTSIQRSTMTCLSICSLNSACFGVNSNKITNECELVSGGQIIQNINLPDWSFYTKC